MSVAARHHSHGVPDFSTTTAPATTSSSTTTAAPRRVEIGTAISIVRHATTTTQRVTTTTTTPSSVSEGVLAVARAEVGKSGPYADGSFFCAKFGSYVGRQAKVPGFVYRDGPAALYADAVSDGRITANPRPGDLAFIDLFGPDGIGHGQATHVGIVESVDGNDLTVLQGNGQPDPSVVTRTSQYRIGDGYVKAFARFGAD